VLIFPVTNPVRNDCNTRVANDCIKVPMKLTNIMFKKSGMATPMLGIITTGYSMDFLSFSSEESVSLNLVRVSSVSGVPWPTSMASTRKYMLMRASTILFFG
jgi:hypothetical protein